MSTLFPYTTLFRSRLVSELLVVARGGDRDARAVADARDVEAADRGAVVGRVVAAQQVGRRGGVAEIDHHLGADLVQVDADVRIREPHDDASGAVGAAPEVDGPQLAAPAGDRPRARRARR